MVDIMREVFLVISFRFAAEDAVKFAAQFGLRWARNVQSDSSQISI